ncbi:hypothetical protein FRC07_002347 [Ceratobasidium sp. 392]|nr:hypothetical protein FRC07_002347 [Ceratobasidium sp. 392]
MSFSGSDTVEVPSSPRRLMKFYFAELDASSEESFSDRLLDSDDPDWMLSLEPSLLCLDLIYGFKKELYSPANKPSAVYCRNWVEGSPWDSQDGIILSPTSSDHGSSDEADRPNSYTSEECDSDDEDDKSQLDSHLDASEAEVDELIQTVEDTEMLDGEEPTNKSDQDTEMSDGADSKANESMEEGEIRPAQATPLPGSASYMDLAPNVPQTPPNRINNSSSRTPATFPVSHEENVLMLRSMYLAGNLWQPTVAGPITAIAFNAPFECLAFSTAHDVTILQRIGAESIQNDTPGDTNFETVGRVEGLSSITCLAFYGSVKLNLVVGSFSGLSVYGIYHRQSLIIAASYDHKIAQCAISKGEHYLAILTPEHKLIYWALEECGPVMQTPTVYDFSNYESPLALSMAITDTNNIVVGTSHGRLYFVDIIGRKRYAGKGFSSEDPATVTVNKDAETFGDKLAYAGAYVINFYLPSSWEAPANSVLIALLCVYQFFEKLFV